MPFYALNTYEEDLLDQAQQYTFELELEKALGLFQDALSFQRAAEYSAAQRLYRDLLALSVFQLHKHKHLPASTYRLKSLVLKNHALLLLHELKHRLWTIESKDAYLAQVSRILATIFDALELSENDISIQEILQEIALQIGYTRVARLALENIVSTEEGRALSVIESAKSANSGRLLSPRDKYLLKSLSDLVHQIDETTVIGETRVIDKFASTKKSLDLSWLNSRFDIRDSYDVLLQTLATTSHEDVPLTTPNWEMVASALEATISAIARRKVKSTPDAYSFSARPINSVRFVAPHGDPMLLDTQESIPVAEGPSEDDTDVEMKELETGPGTPDPNSEKGHAEGSRPVNVAPEPTASDRGVETVEVTSESPSHPSVVKRRGPEIVRSSKRVNTQTPEYVLSSDFGAADRAFSEHISAYLQLCGLKYAPVVTIFSEPDKIPAEEQYLADFKSLLESWDENEGAIFLRSGTPDVNVSQSVMQMLDFAAIGSSMETIGAPFKTDPREISNFLADLELENSHIQQVRLGFLLRLLSSRSGDHQPLILREVFPAPLLNSLVTLIEAFGPELLKRCRSGFSYEYASAIQAIYEYYLDSYVESERALRTCAGPPPKDLVNRIEKLKFQVERWRGASGDILVSYRGNRRNDIQELAFRFQWASVFHDQAAADDPKDSMEKFNSIKEQLKCYMPDLSISFPNWKNLPVISASSVETQLSKHRAASIFATVYSKNSGDNTANSIKILEAMLMPETYKADIPEYKAISHFLATSSLDFKLSLWYQLLENYRSVGETCKSRDGLLQIFKSRMAEINSPEFASMSKYKRYQSLLQCVNNAYDIATHLLPLITANEELVSELDEADLRDALRNIVQLLRLLHVFMLTDQAVNSNLIQSSQHPTWDSAVVKFRKLLVYWWVLFYYFYKASIPEKNRTCEVLNDVLSVIHDQLGNNGYCGLAHNIFLDLNINEMLRLDWPESEADMLQCLHCLYGVSLSSEAFSPFNHHTAHMELTPQAAIKLSKFVMGMVLSRKSLTQSILRSDVRQVIEMFYEAVGSPDSSDSQMRRNKEAFTQFMNTTISLPVLKQSYTGRLQSSFVKCTTPTVAAICDGGFYFVLGLIHLSQFRLKRRSNPEKVEDLHEAIRFFTNDLSCGSMRFESWMGLSQAYDYLAESNLMWSPDMSRGDITETSAITYQRKAILASCVGTSILIQETYSPPLSKEYFQSLKEQIWCYHGKMLFYAAVEPCNMRAFEYQGSKKIHYVDGKCVDGAVATVSSKTILALSLCYLKLAVRVSPGDWFSHYLYGKVLHASGGSPNIVLDEMTKARELRGDVVETMVSRAQDCILEPHQSLITMSSFYCREEKISPDEAMNRMMSSTFASPSDIDPTKAVDTGVVNDLSVLALKRLQAADKKHWLHRPTYWLANFYDQVFNNKNQAAEEMAKLFTLRTNAKAPIQIWKPEIERPGLHFVYVRDYIEYYADLLYDLKDDQLLWTLARKLRRFMGVADHQKVWEHVGGLLAKLIKERIQFPPKYSESIVPQLNPDEFETRSEKLEKWIESQKDSDRLNPWVLALVYALELRKMNNWYGHTAAIDEIVICLYLVVYQLFDPPSGSSQLFLKRGVSSDVEDLKSPEVTSTLATPNDPSSTVSTVFTGASAPSATEGVTADAANPKPAKRRLKIIRRDVVAKAQRCVRLVAGKVNQNPDQGCIPKEIYGGGAQFARDRGDTTISVAFPAASGAPREAAVASDQVGQLQTQGAERNGQSSQNLAEASALLGWPGTDSRVPEVMNSGRDVTSQDVTPCSERDQVNAGAQFVATQGPEPPRVGFGRQQQDTVAQSPFIAAGDNSRH